MARAGCAVVRRRALLRACAAGGAWLLTGGHTPYEQWVVYRKRTLLVGSSRSDPSSYGLAEKIAAALATRIPKSRARLSRAPNYERLASLISTAQLNVAVLARDQALALSRGSAPFERFDPQPLRRLFDMAGYLLVSRADFPAHHAYLVTQALEAPWEELSGRVPVPEDDHPIPAHRGSLAFARGASIPPPPAEAEPATHEHSHDE